MHVAFIDTTLTAFPTGGPHTFLVGLSERLIQRGCTVSVISQPGPEFAVAEVLQRAGAQLQLNLWQAAHLPVERARRLARWVNANAPTVYAISTCPDAGWLALPFLGDSIATVCIAHNDVAAYYDPLRHYGAFIDCAIGVSAEVHRKLTDESCLPAARTRQIAYGVATLSPGQLHSQLRLTDPSRPLRIGYVGRLVQAQKRVMDLVPLVRDLQRRQVAFELHVAGDGPERSVLENELMSGGMPHSPVFWGWLPRHELWRRLAHLDVLLLFSEYEGLPVVLLEAMGQGAAPVVTRIRSGNTEVVRDGLNGYLLDPGDINGFSQRLAELAQDRSRLQSMQRAAWETSRQYGVESMVDAYLDCFHRITSPGFSRAHRPGAGPFPLMPSCRSRYPDWLRKLRQYLVLSARALKVRAAVLEGMAQPRAQAGLK